MFGVAFRVAFSMFLVFVGTSALAAAPAGAVQGGRAGPTDSATGPLPVAPAVTTLPGMAPPAPPTPAASAALPLPPTPTPQPISLSARKIYEQARSQLLQIRTVLKGQASQALVGSGFFVTKDGDIITNFHVVAEAALKPDRYDLVYVTADGREAPVQILQIDVLHDLALLRAADKTRPAGGFDVLGFRAGGQPLAQGERIYSLGNPLDVGFAVIEGTYNGLVRRSFYPQIFFGGSLSAGVSGGPALDEQGRVVGINVARRVDGEQVSFLVPARFAEALLAKGRGAVPITAPAYGIVTEQLMQHQAALTDRFIAQGWKPATRLQHYRLPIPNEDFMRCWGSSQPSRDGGLDVERSDCVMDTRVFVGDYTTGSIGLRHESYDGSKLGTARFAARYSESFRNESFVRLRAEFQTKPQCAEDFVAGGGGLPLRAVVCLRAYKKLTGLYDLSVLVATLDQKRAGVQGRFDAQGLSFANAQKLTKFYLGAYGRVH